MFILFNIDKELKEIFLLISPLIILLLFFLLTALIKEIRKTYIKK